MSRWTHALCAKCYQELEPGREPVRAIGGIRGTGYQHPDCCRCGAPTNGIYYRMDPDKLPCGGEHDDDES